MQRLLIGLGIDRAGDHRRVFAAFVRVLAGLLPPARRTAGEGR